MWARRMARVLKRAVLLVPLALLVGAVLLLPRASPPPLHSVAPPPPLPPLRLRALPPHPLPSLPQEAPNTQPKDEQEEPHQEHVVLEGADEVERRPWYMRGGERRPVYSPNKKRLFPEDAPGEDRIEEQLMYTLPEDETPTVKKIFVPNGLGTWGLSSGGRGEFIKNRCPVDSCSITSDPKEAARADAILFKDHLQGSTFNFKRPHSQIWILYYLECPYHTASLRTGAAGLFNWTSTYRRDSDIVAPYERWVYHDPLLTENKFERNYAANKTKKVAWFVSNCHARNKRLQYARQLSKYISVDIYGACGSLHCPRADPYCLQMLDKDYKFYLAFENSNCRDYITEKFFVNGLGHEALPIVMGARPSEYAATAPHNSYIHVEEFAGPEELAAYLHHLDRNDHLYNSYFKWKGTGEFINTYFFCRVCAMLHAAERQQRSGHYADVTAWWRRDTCVRGDWRQPQADLSADTDNAEVSLSGGGGAGAWD